MVISKALSGVKQRKSQPQPATSQQRPTYDYLVNQDLSQAHLDQDTVIIALLKRVLDMGHTRRKLTEGRSLETQFLEVTGGANCDKRGSSSTAPQK